MADREVTVKTNIVSGTDTISTVLQQQRQEIEALRRAQRELQRESANLPPVAQPLAALSAARVAAIQQARVLEQAPAGLGRDDWRAVLERTREQQVASQQRQRSRELAGLAEARLTGFIPARDVATVAAVGDEEGGGGTGGVRARTRRLRAGVDIAQGGPMAALSALVAMPGPVGLAAAGLLAVGGIATLTAASFERVRYSADALVAVQRQQAEDLRQARQSGVATTAQLQRALTPDEQRQYAQAEERGDEAEQRRIIESARRRNEQEAASAAPGGGGSVAQLQESLTQLNQQIMGEPQGIPGFFGGIGRGIGGQTHTQRWRRAWRAAGVPENQIPALPEGPWTPGQIHEWAQQAGAHGVQAQANAAILGNALMPGGLPSLRPGGLSLADLPNLFQSRQTDVLQVHEEVQREMVRDQRQQAQFERQYDIWVRILARLEAGSASVPPAPGAPGPTSWWGGPAWWGAAS